MFKNLLEAYGLPASDFRVESFGSGLINSTWKVSNGTEEYILQKINSNIFKSPHTIAQNLMLVSNYLTVTAPGYLFPAPIAALNGEHLVYSAGNHYRLALFIKGSHSINMIDNAGQAYEAAKQFGKFTRLLTGFNTTELECTIPDFHNLTLRYHQFKNAINTALPERLQNASAEITTANGNAHIVQTYDDVVAKKLVPLRTIHHDTKINNVLFGDDNKAICVVDLDTIMPGYFMSDVGDMMRTYLSPVNEEEEVIEKIKIRADFFEAVYMGYMGETANILTGCEKSLFIFAGKMMIYMQALRFLTDYLNNDRYYLTTYAGHNLIRAQNQFALLKHYTAAETVFEGIIKNA